MALLECVVFAAATVVVAWLALSCVVKVLNRGDDSSPPFRIGPPDDDDEE